MMLLPKPGLKARLVLYVVGVVLASIISVLSALNVIDGGAAATISAVATWIFGLFGMTGFGTAAWNLNKQRINGTLADVAPADRIINGFNELGAAEDAAKATVDAVAADKARVRDALSGVASNLGPLAQQAINLIK